MDNDINNLRNRGGQISIGSREDGAIIEMLNLNEHLLIIKENAVYELIFADDIDPTRTNPSLPLNSQKLLFEFGTESEIFSRLFLLAKRLFKTEYINPLINTTDSVWLVVDMLQELSEMKKESDSLIELEKQAIKDYDERKGTGLDHATPSIVNIKTKCKTIFQKLDQFYQAQLALVRKFYPDFSEQSYYSKFLEYLQNKYGENDDFFIFIQEVLPIILLSRNIRNCLDHRRSETTITDFELQIDSNILAPTIEINYNGSELKKTSLTNFLHEMIEDAVIIAENTIAFLTSKNLKTNRILPGYIKLIPEQERVNKYCKFAYWSPIGEGGFYDQR